jgi:hypothetical protein
MKQTANGDASRLEGMGISEVKPRLLSRDIEATRSESTSPSFQTYGRYSKGVRSLSKDRTPHKPMTEHGVAQRRHTAAIKELNQTSRSMIKVQRQFKRGVSQAGEDSYNLPEAVWSGPSARFAKKNPPSLYNSSRNVQSFEHYTARQEVMHRIGVVGKLVDDLTPGCKKEVTKPLKEMFQYCVETESKTYFHVWFKLLQTFEQLFTTLNKKPVQPILDEEIDDSTLLSTDLDIVMNRDLDFENPKAETMAMIVKDLSKLWRTATHKVTNKDTFNTLETIWNALVKILNKSISAQAAKVAKAFESVQEQTKQERMRQKRLMDLMLKNFEDKFVMAR